MLFGGEAGVSQIAFLENNLQADGTVRIPAVLQPYMGGQTLLVPTKKEK